MQDQQVPEKHLSDAILANDRLLKALISLLVVENPGRLEHLRTIFNIAETMQSPIAEMPDWTWRRIEQELGVISASFGPELH
jgi:hypothetical protein